MAREKASVFVCQQCGEDFAKWFGKCPNCGEWNSLVETSLASASGKGSRKKSGRKAKPVKLSSVTSKKIQRISTKISELDRVLGGGLVAGQVVLLAGEPGIGKSTILLQLADKLGNVLYVSGEESAAQVAIRGKRLDIKRKTIEILEETDIDSVIGTIGSPKLVIIDSIQTMATQDLSGMAGSVGQVRECTGRLVRLAKRENIPVILVGHVTKEGTVAGPATLAHMVDTVLSFEGSKTGVLRLLRAEKNRFGPTDEVGIFMMAEGGLIPVDDASKLFLSDSRKMVPGSCVASIMEGTRPVLVEIQSLVVPTKLAFPRRSGQGIEARRLEMILAVLERRLGLKFYNFDVFVNVVGGIKVKEPSADLAIALSLASAYFDKPLPRKLLAIGEIGLLGEVRKVTAEEKRIKEAKRQGFNQIVNCQLARYLPQAIKQYFKR